MAKNKKIKPNPISQSLVLEASLCIEASGEDSAALPSFSLKTYNGGLLHVWHEPVVIDLNGLDVSTQEIPLLCDHAKTVDSVLGQTQSITKTASEIHAAGVITSGSQRAQEVVTNSKNGYQWQNSVGVRITKTQHLEAGETVQVNGQEFTGPLYVALESSLREISLTPLGADPDTQTAITARQTNTSPVAGELNLTPAALTAGDLQEPPMPPTTEEIKAAARAQAIADERERIASIEASCQGFESDDAAMALRTQAVSGEITPDALNAALVSHLRASRPVAPAIHAKAPVQDATVLEAAIRMGGNEPDATVEASYTPAILEAAHSMRRISLKGLIEASCRLDGRTCPSLNDEANTWVEAAFSTNTLSDIFKNVGHKSMLAAFKQHDSTAVKLARKLTANDFKVHTGYRAKTGGTWGEVGADGELKHGDFSEEKVQYRVETYGEIMGITRKDIINDDMGVLQALPTMMGRKAFNTREKLFWNFVIAVIDNATKTGNLVHAKNGNYITGADSALGISGLDMAVQALESLVDSNGDDVVVDAKYLLVPPALKALANRINKSDKLDVGTSTEALVATANTHQGAFEPLTARALKDTKYVNQWGLFADPTDVAAFGLVYLNGNEGPTIEEVPLSGEFLGTSWRGFMDIGVCQLDPQGLIWSKGKA